MKFLSLIRISQVCKESILTHHLYASLFNIIYVDILSLKKEHLLLLLLVRHDTVTTRLLEIEMWN